MRAGFAAGSSREIPIQVRHSCTPMDRGSQRSATSRIFHFPEQNGLSFADLGPFCVVYPGSRMVSFRG